MANSDLVGKQFRYPPKIKKIMQHLVDNAASEDLSGYERLQNYLYKGYMVYDDLKVMLKLYNANNLFFSSNKYGLLFLNWVDKTLNEAREKIEHSKEVKTKNGYKNQYRKSHTKTKTEQYILNKIKEVTRLW